MGLVQIVDISCTYPGAAATRSVAGFWSTAIDADDLPTVIPYNRWAIERHYSPDVTGGGREGGNLVVCSEQAWWRCANRTLLYFHAVEKMYVRFAGFIPDVELFDAALFRYGCTMLCYMSSGMTC